MYDTMDRDDKNDDDFSHEQQYTMLQKQQLQQQQHQLLQQQKQQTFSMCKPLNSLILIITVPCNTFHKNSAPLLTIPGPVRAL